MRVSRALGTESAFQLVTECTVISVHEKGMKYVCKE